MTDSIFIFIYLILIVSFIAFTVSNKETYVYGVKVLWYALAVMYGILHFFTEATGIENIYTALVFIIVIIELLDNLRLMGLNKPQKEN